MPDIRWGAAGELSRADSWGSPVPSARLAPCPFAPKASSRAWCGRSAVSTLEVPGVPAAPLSYREAWALIEARGQSILPDLARVEALVELLDHPQATYPTLQIAGTNGKSSTARIIGAVLAAHGLTAGVYTSPHLQSIRERYLLAGPVTEPSGAAGVLLDAIPPDEFAALVQYLLPFVELVEERTGQRVTYFELTTVLAFEWMATHSVNAGIYEAGMGGAWDATNVVPSSVAVLTHVAVDHAAMLGPTPLDNAREKVGIIKPGASVVSTVQDPDVGQLVSATAADAGANLVVMGRDFHLRADELALRGRLITVEGPAGGIYEEVFLPLLGHHQAVNATLALAACEELIGRPLDAGAVEAGLASVTSPGRMEVVAREPVVVLDGAHNPEAAAALGRALQETFGRRERTFVISIFEDKDIEGMLAALLPSATRTIFTRNSNPRAAAPEALAEVATRLGFKSELVEPLAEAIETGRRAAGEHGIVVVTGSLATAGEARTLLVGPVE
ncbi:MAG: bifunctional folylpolyglutamate synthase/dihydrofolate synthase [Actinobacteria bacterium]|nr:MAG: bifunctional folylpolyglutamate synthase/dihydrofolate synthase [Actinomycetota bacterium]